MTQYQRRPVVADAARYDGSPESLDAIADVVGHARADRWTSRVLVDRNGETSWARLKEGQWVLAIGDSVEVVEPEQFAVEYVDLEDVTPAPTDEQRDAFVRRLSTPPDLSDPHVARVNYLEELLGREVASLSDLMNIFGIPVDHPNAETEVMRSLDGMSLPWESPGGVQPLDPCFLGTTLARTKRWHPGGVDDWPLEDWLCAMGGELGEAMEAALQLKEGQELDTRAEFLCAIGARLGASMNYSKKLRRLEDEIANDDVDMEQGDYLGLITMELVEMQRLASILIGELGVRPTSRFLARQKPRRASTVLEELADVLLYLPQTCEAAEPGGAARFNLEVTSKFDEVSVRYGFPERMGARR